MRVLNLVCCSHKTLSERSVRDLQQRARESALLGLRATSCSTIHRNTSSTWNGWQSIWTIAMHEGILQVAGVRAGRARGVVAWSQIGPSRGTDDPRRNSHTLKPVRVFISLLYNAGIS